jgi:hypothetical protein
VDHIDLKESDEAFDAIESDLPSSISPREVLSALRQRAELFIGQGDYRAASRIEDELIPKYTSWLSENRVFSLEKETSGGRLLLKDEDGVAWIVAKRQDL